jgi:hypothetical protein
MSKNYKNIPVTMRDHLHELTGNELKVWLYLHLRTGKESTAYPGNKTIANDIGLSLDTVKDARASLRRKGWFSKESRRRNLDGTLSTVVEKTHLPWVEKTTMEGEKTPHGTKVEFTSAGKTTQQKEYTENLEGAAARIQENLEGSVLTNGVSQLVVSESIDHPEKQEALSSTATTVLSHIYPRAIPSGVEPSLISRLETFLANNPVDWKDYFAWHRTHKPEGLRWRSLDTFLQGIEYSLNDLWGHDANICKVCNPKGKSSATAEYPEPQAASGEPTILGAPIPTACHFHREELVAASRMHGDAVFKRVNDLIRLIEKCSKCDKIKKGDLSHIGYCLGCGEDAHGGTMREDGLCAECYRDGRKPESGSMEEIIAKNRAKAAAANSEEEA